MDNVSTHIDSPSEVFRRAVVRMGGQMRTAGIIGRTQGAISKRLSKGLPLWAEDVLKVEEATGISRHDLRPDIYPIESDTAPPSQDGRLGAGPALHASRVRAGHHQGSASIARGAA